MGVSPAMKNLHHGLLGSRDFGLGPRGAPVTGGPLQLFIERRNIGGADGLDSLRPTEAHRKTREGRPAVCHQRPRRELDLSHSSTAIGRTSAIRTEPHLGSICTFIMEPSVFRVLFANAGRYSSR
jgi:hypothetical protein